MIQMKLFTKQKQTHTKQTYRKGGRDRLPTPILLSFPGGSAGKESASNAGDLGSIPGLGRSPVEGNGYSLQYRNKSGEQRIYIISKYT